MPAPMFNPTNVVAAVEADQERKRRNLFLIVAAVAAWFLFFRKG
jgi:hypothetical protein